ncbi:MAG: hypothetical protein FWC92_06200 [Defluviitaleaceae bacterium]|nr:hypothetical protein [Defluviitaleaceae bacterium]
MKGKIAGGVTALVWVALWSWLGWWRFNIPVTIGGFGPFIYWGVFNLGGGIALYCIGMEGDYHNKAKLNAPGSGNGAKAISIFVLLVVLFIIGGGLSGSAMFRARPLANQIYVSEAVPFQADDLPAFDPTQIPWVDAAYARVLGDQRLGELGAIGAEVRIGTYVRQLVNGQLFYVAPILHDGFLRWNANRLGTPGYIMVSMTDDRDVRLVTDNRIRIQPSGHAAFGDKLERIVHNAAPTALRFNPIFLICDDLLPHWVVPIRVNRVGLWGGRDVDGIIIVNATTGAVSRYGLDNVPYWVDIVHPIDVVERQLSNWGTLRGGWVNSWAGRRGLIQLEDGNAIVYHQGYAYLFDALTAAGGNDESTIGFILTNLRTKETRHFSLTGATERAAMLSAQGDPRVAAQRYRATFPLPVMIEGQVAYFMALTDPNSNIAQAFALVNVQRHQIVGIGNTPRAAESDYRMRLHATGAGGLHTPTANLLEIEGEVVRWGQYSSGGNTFFTFMVSGHEDRLFRTDTSQPEAVLTQVGDRVRFYVLATEGTSWSVIVFENLEFDLARGELEDYLSQAELDRRMADIQGDDGGNGEE